MHARQRAIGFVHVGKKAELAVITGGEGLAALQIEIVSRREVRIHHRQRHDSGAGRAGREPVAEPPRRALPHEQRPSGRGQQRQHEHRVVKASADLQQDAQPEADDVASPLAFQRAMQEQKASGDPLRGHQLDAPNFEEHIGTKGEGNARQQPGVCASRQAQHQQIAEEHRQRERRQQGAIVRQERVQTEQVERGEQQRQPEVVLVERKRVRQRREVINVIERERAASQQRVHMAAHDHRVGVRVPVVRRAQDLLAGIEHQRPRHQDRAGHGD